MSLKISPLFVSIFIGWIIVVLSAVAIAAIGRTLRALLWYLIKTIFFVFLQVYYLIMDFKPYPLSFKDAMRLPVHSSNYKPDWFYKSTK